MPMPIATISIATNELADERLYLRVPCLMPPTIAAMPRIPLISNMIAANTVSRARVGFGAPANNATRITTSTDTAASVRISVP